MIFFRGYVIFPGALFHPYINLLWRSGNRCMEVGSILTRLLGWSPGKYAIASHRSCEFSSSICYGQAQLEWCGAGISWRRAGRRSSSGATCSGSLPWISASYCLLCARPPSRTRSPPRLPPSTLQPSPISPTRSRCISLPASFLERRHMAFRFRRLYISLSNILTPAQEGLKTVGNVLKLHECSALMVRCFSS